MNLLALLPYNKLFKTILKFSQFACKHFSTIDYTKRISVIWSDKLLYSEKGFL